jgi:hypothetical protein
MLVTPMRTVRSEELSLVPAMPMAGPAPPDVQLFLTK